MPGQTGGMGQMIQVITALSQIQQQRRELDMKQKQMDQTASQFAESMGYEKSSSEHKKFTELLKQIAESGTKQRGALVDAGKAMGFNDDEVKALTLMAANAPETMQAIQQGAVQKGMASMNPQQMTSMNQEAASQALTGMNQGQVANSGLSAILGQGAQKQVTPQMQQGYAQRAATNQTPLDAIISATIASNPDMRGRMAAVTAGTRMTAAQSASAETARGQLQATFEQINQESIYHQAEIAEKLATAKAQGSLSPQMVQLTEQMNQFLKTAADGKANDAVRTNAMAMYNNLADQIGWPDMKFGTKNPGGPASTGERARNFMGGQPPVPNAPPFSSSLQFPNPLQQFVRPPQ